MTTLKEKITQRFEFNESNASAEAKQFERDFGYGDKPMRFRAGAKWHNDQMKQDLLPILLECVEALEKANKKLQEINEMFVGQNMEVMGWHLNHTTEPLDNFFEENNWKPENEALERLRKWSEK